MSHGEPPCNAPCQAGQDILDTVHCLYKSALSKLARGMSLKNKGEH